MVKRAQETEILEKLKSHKLLLVKGPEQAKKEEFILELLTDKNVLFIDLSDIKKRKTYFSEDQFEIPAHTQAFVLIKNAQYIPNLNQFIENSIASTNNANLILCFAFEPELDELLQEVIQFNELEINIYPPTFSELAQGSSPAKIDSDLHQRIIFGNQEEVILNPEMAEQILLDKLEDVLKTQLGFGDRINKINEMKRMLQLLAFNIGEHVSYNELAVKIGLDNETVERYINLLEKAFILIVLPTWCQDKRYELKKSHSIYFVDNGLRNALIKNFNEPDFRNDMPALWTNWIISERVKFLKIKNQTPEFFFWRTHTRLHIDLIEFHDGHLRAYICDWEKRKPLKFPKTFTEYYPNAKTTIINKSTYWNFLTRL